MNEFIQKIKKLLLSVYGRCLIFIFVLAFIITTILSIVQRNAIIYSLLRGILSGALACFILYGVYMALSKVLGDVFTQIFSVAKESDEATVDNINEFLDSNADKTKEDLEYSEKNVYNSNYVDGENHINNASSALNVAFDIDENIENTVDKNSKVSYHNSSDDISSIVFGSGFNNASKTTSTNEVKATSDNKESNKIVKSMPLDNPELLAKAVRTMRAKDKEKENN